MREAWRVEVGREERAAVGWSAACFFLLMCGYSLLRPLRESLGVTGGVERLPSVFTVTFIGTLIAVPLFSAIVARFRARLVVPVAYHAFAASLVVFAVLALEGTPPWLARTFFSWVSICNLLVVSIFWALLADVFDGPQAARLFGLVAAGGSAGAIAGPLLATLLAHAGAPALLVISAALIEGSVLCAQRVVATGAGHGELAKDTEHAIGGSPLAAWTLLVRSRYLLLAAAVVVLFTSTSTFAYLEQARIARDAFADEAARTRFFASIDLAVNVLAVVIQLSLASRILVKLGAGVALALLPVVTAVGLAALAASPTPLVLAVFQTVRRGLHYGLDRPARELLFTVAGREAKYKSKSFIDTVLYRGGDAVSGWAHAGLAALGLSAAALSLTALPLCAAWLAAVLQLGKRHRMLQDRVEESPACPSPVAT